MSFKPQRLRFFNKVMVSYEKFRENHWQYGLDEPRGTEDGDYNLVSSLCTDGKHHPALDVDKGLTVVESSTPGHYHLYWDDVALTWYQYKHLLETLAHLGMVDDEWVRHSIRKGYSSLRPPHVKKEERPAPLWEPPVAPAGHWMTPPSSPWLDEDEDEGLLW